MPRRPTRRNPRCEGLEGRALLSLAGGPDLGYGAGGFAAVPLAGSGLPGTQTFLDGAAIQADGKVVVSGVVENPGASAAPFVTSAARLDASGKLDPTFGNGGVIALPAAGSVAIQADGKALIAGGAGGVAYGLYRGTGSLVRLGLDGRPDPSFGFEGVAPLILAGFPTITAERVAVEPDGKVVVAALGVAGGPTLNGLATGAAVFRFQADGRPDVSFGAGGIAPITFGGLGTPGPVALDAIQGLAIQPDGRIVLAGTASDDPTHQRIVVERLDLAGNLDPSFGLGGVVALPATAGGNLSGSEVASAVLVQPDGKIVVAGAAPKPGTLAGPSLAVRLGPDGTLDPTFGRGGASLGGVTGGLDAQGQDSTAALGADGRVLLGSRTGLTRLRADGTIDPTFGRAGTATPGGSLVAIQADGKALLLSALGPALARVLPIGAPGDYDGDGISDRAVYLPAFGAFADRPSGGGADPLIAFGAAGPGQTLPAPGAYDGLGRTELGVYLPALGAFAYRPAAGGPDVVAPFGPAGAGAAIPAVGDYDGSGRDELAAYLPGLGALAYRPAGGGPDRIIPFGPAGPGQAIPAPGDYDGDGKTDLAAYLPALGAFAVRPSSGGPDKLAAFGIPGAGQAIPAPGDYDGDGKADLAAYLPALGAFAYRPSSGGPDRIIRFGNPGPGQTLPAPGDYDGSGRTEIAAYLPGPGIFAYRPAGGGPDVLIRFGTPGTGRTIPFVGAYSASPATTASALAVPDFAPDTSTKKNK